MILSITPMTNTAPGTSSSIVNVPSVTSDPYTDCFAYYSEGDTEYTVQSKIATLLKDDLLNAAHVIMHKIEVNYAFTGPNQKVAHNYCFIEEAVAPSMMGMTHGGNYASSGSTNDHFKQTNPQTATLLLDNQIKPVSANTMEPTFYLYASKGVRVMLYIYVKRSAPRIVYRPLANLK